MNGKKITELSDEELNAEIERLQQIPIPASPSAKRPKRLDATPKKRKTLYDIVTEGGE